MRFRAAAGLCALAIVAAACGQKPGVHARAAGLSQVPGGSLTGETSGVPAPTATPSFDPATGQYIDPLTGQAVDPTTGQPITGATPAPGTGLPSAGGGGGGGSVSGDTTGVTDKSITLGLHAPVTGAAPVRSDSFETGRDLYWRGGGPGGGAVRVHGRTVKVLFANDRYNPSTATQKCKSMAQSGKAFALIGGAGTDQIYSCARYAAANGIPYLSAGVAQNSLSPFPNYFALSMTYKQQGKLLSDFIKKNARRFDCSGRCRVAMIVTNTANFDDAIDGFKKAYGSVTVIRPSKSDSGAEYGDQICTGPQKKVDVVYPLTAPTFFLELAGSPTASCRPQYVGVGISMGLDTVANTGCKSDPESMHGSLFFSPAPAYRDVGVKDKAFVKAGGSDDIEWLLWGLMKDMHHMFLKAGKNLSRQSFVQAVQSSSFNTGIFPPLSYSQGNRFGATKVNVLRAVCESNRGGYYRTFKRNAPPF